MPKNDNKIIKIALIKSLNYIYSSMLESPFTAIQEEVLPKMDELLDAIQISIDVKFSAVNDDFHQLVVLTFPKDTFLKAANEMLQEKFTEIGEHNIDVELELSNMMLGRAKQTLSVALWAKFYLTTPVLLESSDVPKAMTNEKCVVTTLMSKIGINHLITIC